MDRLTTVEIVRMLEGDALVTASTGSENLVGLFGEIDRLARDTTDPLSTLTKIKHLVGCGKVVAEQIYSVTSEAHSRLSKNEPVILASVQGSSDQAGIGTR